MKVKRVYLLVFLVLLTYYSYLCLLCTQTSLSECARHILYDRRGIFRCLIQNDTCVKSGAYSFPDCQNATDTVINMVGENYIIENGLCEYLDNNCYTDNNRCYLIKCENLKKFKILWKL